jgi:hypothetical protein
LVAKFVDADKRRFGLRDGGVGPVARRPTYRAPVTAIRRRCVEVVEAKTKGLATTARAIAETP